MEGGFVMRYRTATAPKVDGLPPGEGAFLPCTYWLCDNYAITGRMDEARALFTRLLALRNDVGLLSEQYHPGQQAAAGELSASVLARVAGQHRAEPDPGPRTGARS